MSVKIIIDSTCDLLPEIKARCAVVPLTVRFGEREYRDGVDIGHREFYRMLTTGQEMPTTSQASPADFEQVYRDCIHQGLVDIFLDAGCIVSTPTCGPCLGGHMGCLAAGERCVSTTNRNFVGRMGHVDSEVYLASPAVAAASGIAGHIAHPEEV